jgi:class 3 adenylate cyclase
MAAASGRRAVRRARTVDWLLIATLLPAHLAIQGLALRNYLPHGGRWFPFSVVGAQGAVGHPLVDRVNAPGGPLRVGDRVRSANGVDLRGMSRAEVYRAQTPLLAAGRPYPVVVERDAELLQVDVVPIPRPWWVWRFLAPAPLLLVAVFLLLRAPHWHLSRRFFVATVLLSSYGPADTGQLPWVIAACPFGFALALECALESTEAVRLRPRQRLLLGVLGGANAAIVAVYLLGTVRAGLWPYRASWGFGGMFFFLVPVALAWNYTRSGVLERRQLRWLLYSFFVAFLPTALFSAAVSIGVELDFQRWYGALGAAYLAIPLGIAVSVIGYHWLDIDRLISATAAVTLVAVALVGAAALLVPRLAAGASGALGVDPEAGRVAFSMALAGVAVPVYRSLQPWLDRRLFAADHALGESFGRLRAELGGCGGVEELVTRAGEGIDALLHPESVATYGRAGDAFAPLFVRGRAAPGAFERGSTLVQVLEAKAAPLFARAREIAPFERAALETLGAEVVVPVMRDGQLVAFTCLAGKRSGDVYTATDLERLGSVAERCGDVLARLDADAVARDARELQAALRRYVPGSVAEKVVRGEALAQEQREVTVLFVDLRGYTTLAEGLGLEDVFATLNEHTERVSRLVQEGGGTVVEFNGDGMMAVFGAPEPLPRKELHAVEAARRITDAMPSSLSVGVGVATGSAFVGSIRATDRFIWTAVGSTTNLASRLQSLTRELDAVIAVDETTRARAGYVCSDFVRHPAVAIRGRTGRFDVFALPAQAVPPIAA